VLAVIGKCVDKEPEPEPEPDSRGRAGGSYCIHTSLESAASWMHELYVGKTFRTTGRVC